MRLFKAKPLMQSMDIAPLWHFSPDGIRFALDSQGQSNEAVASNEYWRLQVKVQLLSHHSKLTLTSWAGFDDRVVASSSHCVRGKG
jgi:hypothetical protein